MNREPDPRADGMSADDYCAQLPKQRLSHEAQGRLLFLPREGLTVVPFRKDPHGWTVTVVEGDGRFYETGHNLQIGDEEINTAIELSPGEPVPARFVNTLEEAEALPEGEAILSRNGQVLRKELRGGLMWWLRPYTYALPSESLNASFFPAKVLDSEGPDDA